MKSSNGKSLNLYYTSWATYGRDHQVADLAKLIEAGATDVSYSFFNLKQEGNGWVIVSGDEWAEFQKVFPGQTNLRSVGSPDNWDDSSSNRAGNFGQLRKLKESGAQFNLHLSIGGWTWSKNFSLAVRTAESRQTLLNSIISFLKKYPMFNGVDFDWEYLSTDGKNYGNDGNIVHPDDGKNFRDFLVLLRQALVQNGMGSYIVGMCCTPAPEKAQFNISEIHPLIDELRVMTYDLAGSWDLSVVAHHANPRKSRYGSYSVEKAVDFYISKGVPSTKIMIGAAYYSRGWSGTDGLGKPATANSTDFQFQEEMGVVPYHMLPRPGASEFWDDEAKAGYSYDPAKKILNTYDTVDSVLEKCKMVHEKNLRGIIVWESAGDVKPDNPRSLTSALKRGLFDMNFGTGSVPSVPVPSVLVPSVPVPSVPVPSVPVPSSGDTSEWKTGGSYKSGDKVVFEGKVYQAVTTHTVVDPNWTPKTLWTTKTSLWKLVGEYVPPVSPPVSIPSTSTSAIPPPPPNSPLEHQATCCQVIDEIQKLIEKFKSKK